MTFRKTSSAVVICAILLGAVVMAVPALAQEHWLRLTTSHFEMYSSSDEKKSREAIQYFERVREFFMQASPVRAPGEFPVRIVAFKDSPQMHFYAPNKSVAAYFSPGPVRDSIVMQDPSPESYPITIHEYVHLLIRHSGLRLPLWLNEGWSDVYSTLKPVKDGVAVGDLIPRHVSALARAKWFTLSELQAVTSASPEYNESSRTGMFYAESWALAHMLYLSPEYKSNFGRFIGALNRGSTIQDALLAAYKKTEFQVLEELQTYLSRKSLYGTVFLVPLEKSGEAPTVTPVSAWDAGLMLADLHAIAPHIVEANRAYQQLEADDPTRPEPHAGAGYLAVFTGDKPAARREFRKAVDLGTADPQLCMQLAALDREAKQPPSVVMDDLEHAVKLRPDFSEAIFELAVLKLDARDFETALSLFGRVGMVSPDRMTIFRSAMAYSNLEMGNVTVARRDAEAAERAATTPAEKQAAQRLVQLIDARSKGPAAALPGEKIVRAEGTAVGLRCATPNSGTPGKMGISINGKQMIFDMPEAAAVEVLRQPTTKEELKCGVLPPFHLVVEYAPASVANRESSGIIRRLEY